MKIKQWNTDIELFDFIRKELYTAVVGDIMDKMGLINQFLPPQIRPLKEDSRGPSYTQFLSRTDSFYFE